MLLTERPGAGPARWSSDEPTDAGDWDEPMPEHMDTMGLLAGLAPDVAADLRQARYIDLPVGIPHPYLPDVRAKSPRARGRYNISHSTVVPTSDGSRAQGCA